MFRDRDRPRPHPDTILSNSVPLVVPLRSKASSVLLGNDRSKASSRALLTLKDTKECYTTDLNLKEAKGTVFEITVTGWGRDGHGTKTSSSLYEYLINSF